MPLLNRSDIPDLTALVAGGVSDIEIGKRYGTCPQNVMKFRAKHGIFRVPWGRQREQKVAPMPVRQTGERWSEEYQFMIKLISPAWAAGDIHDE